MKPLDSLRWTLFLLAFVALLASCYFAFKDAGWTFSYLRSIGWTEYLEIENPNPALFIIQCNADPDCRGVFFAHYKNESLSLHTILLAVMFFTCLFAAALTRVIQGGPKQKDPGGSKFASDKDLKKYLKDDKDDPEGNPRVSYLGFTESGKAIKPRMRDRCTHVAIFAGTGGGKTTRIIKPSLIADAEDGVSVLMVDPKWPDPQGGYSDLLAVYEAKGYDMQVFCPFNEHTMHLPLLSSIKTREDAVGLATMIVPRQDGNENSEGSQFYKNLERRLLLFLIQGALLENNYSMASLYQRLEAGPTALRTWMKTLPDESLKNALEAFLELRQDALIGVMQGLMSSLEIFTDPRLDAATQASPHGWKNLNPSALVEKKAALYVGIPNYLILRGEGKLLLSLFFRHIMNGLMAIAEKSGGTLPRHVAVYIDEFAHIGRIDDAANWFGTMRSYKIGFTVAMQNRAQLELVYGTLAAKALSGGNFQHLITFPSSLTGDDKEYISDLLGEVTVRETSNSRSRHHIFELPRKTVTEKLVPRALVSREEMNSWPEDVGILDPHGAPPTKIIAPRVNQRSAMNVKNPFYRYGRQLEGINAVELVQAILNRRRYRWMTEPVSHDALKEQRQRQPQDPAVAPDYVLPKDPATRVEDKPEVAQTQAEQAATVTSSKKLPAAPQPSKRVNTNTPPTKKTEKSSPSPPRKPKVRPALENVPQGELIQAFRAWISSLRWKQVPVTVYTVRAGGQDRVSKVLFEVLPGALRHEYLGIWKRRKWVRIHHEKFGIVGIGTSVLCKNQLQSFMDAKNSQVIDVGDGDERVVIKARQDRAEQKRQDSSPKGDQLPLVAQEAKGSNQAETSRSDGSGTLTLKDAQALWGWYTSNRASCANDELFEHLMQTGAKPGIKGLIERHRFLLPKATVERLIGQAVHAFPDRHLTDTLGNKCVYVSLSVDLAMTLLPLKTWLLEHKPSLQTYTTDVSPKPNPDTLGFYQPTYLSLTPEALEEDLPRIPKTAAGGAYRWRPRIHKQRPRMLRYIIHNPLES